MTFKEHLSEEIVKSFLNNGLPKDKKDAIGLHLSYCPICREQRDEVALKLAVQRMREAYEQSNPPADSHIPDRILRDFWRSKLSREEITNLSHHCIVCRDCGQRREQARIALENERARDRERAFIILVVAAVAAALKKHPIFATAVAVFLFVVSVLFFRNSQTAIPRSPNNAKSPEVVVVPTDPSPSSAFQARQNQEPSVDSSTKSGKPSGQQARRNNDIPSDLITQLDFRQGDVYRSPISQANKAKTIIASRSGPTYLRIGLPMNSRKGVYDVSIRDSASVDDEIVSTIGKSPDGVRLFICIKMQNLEADEADKYVLRITYRNPETGISEYIGDYPVRVILRASAGEIPKNK